MMQIIQINTNNQKQKRTIRSHSFHSNNSYIGIYNSGFTLMEVIIYIPIFAILLGGGVLTAYSLIESSSRNQAIFMVYDEGNFLESKINWVIGGSISVNTPVPGTPSGSLSVTKIDGSNVSINQLGDDITITYGNSAPIILNNRNIKISNLVFDNQVSSTSQLVKSSMLVTVTTGDGKSFAQDFTTSKYIRK